MWSLPDINRMNAVAASLEVKSRIQRTVEDPPTLNCVVCEWEGKDTPADTAYEVHDIFSDDAKDALGVCEEHDGATGAPVEGYFTCEDCERVMVSNYTWENYFVWDEDSILCINCARKARLAEPGSWIDLTDGEIEEVDFERIRRAPHLFAVGQKPEDHGLREVGGVLYDSMTGSVVTGDDIQSMLRKARDGGATRATLILDGAFQFSVSIGVYVEANP
jgi:hypothetical protein